MPYIHPDDRPDYNDILESLSFGGPGELNYVFTKTIQKYFEGFARIGYAEMNEVIGALECCKLELYRRMVVPYEDKKIAENGDVY
jgi:hypothetical protein